MPETFEYFDGREWAGDHFYEWEADSLDIEIEEHEVMMHGGGRHQQSATISVEPPCRLLYPRPVESVDEARRLYLADEIDIYEFEDYLESLL